MVLSKRTTYDITYTIIFHHIFKYIGLYQGILTLDFVCKSGQKPFSFPNEQQFIILQRAKLTSSL